MTLRLVDPTPKKQTGFDLFMEIYPRKMRRGRARRAYLYAIMCFDEQEILEGARRFAAHCASLPESERKYIPFPASWIADEGWADEYETDGITAALEEVFK